MDWHQKKRAWKHIRDWRLNETLRPPYKCLVAACMPRMLLSSSVIIMSFLLGLFCAFPSLEEEERERTLGGARLRSSWLSTSIIAFGGAEVAA